MKILSTSAAKVKSFAGHTRQGSMKGGGGVAECNYRAKSKTKQVRDNDEAPTRALLESTNRQKLGVLLWIHDMWDMS